MGVIGMLSLISFSFVKREVLQIIAKIFDLAGWLGAIFVTAKLLMQKISNEKIDWDEFLTPEIIGEKFFNDYSIINDIKISR